MDYPDSGFFSAALMRRAPTMAARESSDIHPSVSARLRRLASHASGFHLLVQVLVSLVRY